MGYWKTVKFIAWLPVAVGIGLVVTAPASAGPFNGQSYRAETHPNVILVDHRYERRRGPRARHRGNWRYREKYSRRRHGRHGRRYHDHGRHDAAAYDWLAFTAITVKLLDVISVSQQRAYNSAQVRASAAPVGETVYWDQDGASGAVTPVREGTSTAGRYCREFQQTLTVGGKTESAYGTACRQPDGSWELLP